MHGRNQKRMPYAKDHVTFFNALKRMQSRRHFSGFKADPGVEKWQLTKRTTGRNRKRMFIR